jgi:hypothetical protein
VYEDKGVKGYESKEDIGNHVGKQREITVYLAPESATRPSSPKSAEIILIAFLINDHFLFSLNLIAECELIFWGE